MCLRREPPREKPRQPPIRIGVILWKRPRKLIQCNHRVTCSDGGNLALYPPFFRANVRHNVIPSPHRAGHFLGNEHRLHDHLLPAGEIHGIAGEETDAFQHKLPQIVSPRSDSSVSSRICFQTVCLVLSKSSISSFDGITFSAPLRWMISAAAVLAKISML